MSDEDLADVPDDEEPIFRCDSCGVPFAVHLGLVGTCAANQRLKAEVDRLRKLNVALSERVFAQSQLLTDRAEKRK